jgi:hypothetical protein
MTLGQILFELRAFLKANKETFEQTLMFIFYNFKKSVLSHLFCQSMNPFHKQKQVESGDAPEEGFRYRKV